MQITFGAGHNIDEVNRNEALSVPGNDCIP